MVLFFTFFCTYCPSLKRDYVKSFWIQRSPVNGKVKNWDQYFLWYSISLIQSINSSSNNQAYPYAKVFLHDFQYIFTIPCTPNATAIVTLFIVFFLFVSILAGHMRKYKHNTCLLLTPLKVRKASFWNKNK